MESGLALAGALALTSIILFSTPLQADEPPELQDVKDACDKAISDWAKQFDPVKVDTRVTGSIGSDGPARTVVLDVQVDYNRNGGVQSRKARIECRVGGDGSVTVKESM